MSSTQDKAQQIKKLQKLESELHALKQEITGLQSGVMVSLQNALDIDVSEQDIEKSKQSLFSTNL